MSKKLLFLGVIMFSVMIFSPVEVSSAECEDCCLINGDYDNDGILTYSDYFGYVNALFNGSVYPGPDCDDQGDFNADSVVYYTDGYKLTIYLFTNDDLDSNTDCL